MELGICTAINGVSFLPTSHLNTLLCCRHGVVPPLLKVKGKHRGAALHVVGKASQGEEEGVEGSQGKKVSFLGSSQGDQEEGVEGSHGKKAGLVELFSSLLGSTEPNLDFVIQPTLKGGLNVGAYWQLDWRNKPVPIGKGFSFSISHTYKGSFLIRDVHLLIGPYENIELLRLKLMGILMYVMDKLPFPGIIKSKGVKGVAYSLLIFTALFVLFRSALF